MRCSNCGKTFSNEHKFCIYCAAPVSPAVNMPPNQPQLNRCRVCGCVMEPGNTFCPNCGTPLSQGDAAPTRPAGAVGQAQNRRCSGCGAELNAEDIFCANCGTAVTPTDTAPATPVGAAGQVQGRRCPACGWELLPNDIFCINCGTPLTPKGSISADPYDRNVGRKSRQLMQKKHMSGFQKFLLIMTGILFVLMLALAVAFYTGAISSDSLTIPQIANGDFTLSSILDIFSKSDRDDKSAGDTHKDGGEKAEDGDKESEASPAPSATPAETAPPSDVTPGPTFPMPPTISSFPTPAVVPMPMPTSLVYSATPAPVQSDGGGDFIIFDSDSRYLTEEDIANLSLRELCYARNEIYARHGRIFKSPELSEYFASKDWYTPRYDPDSFDVKSKSLLSKYEIDNAYYLRQAELAISPGGYALDK